MHKVMKQRDEIRRQIELGGRRCTLRTTNDDTDNGSLRGRLFYLFISIKNRDFDREFVSWFVDLCEADGLLGRVCAVDEPYLFNRQAELDLDHLPEAEIEKISKLSTDRIRMAERVLRRSRSARVSIVRWQQLSTETPDWMKKEVMDAYRMPGSFRDEVRRHVTAVKEPGTEASTDRYARFLLCETPVLIHTYYSPASGVVDVYPGPNCEPFWMIEQGQFAGELPRTTAFARSGRPLAYVDASGAGTG